MPSGGAPREYPTEIVDLICGMYGSGMTVAEIRQAAPKGYRVQTILERYLPERRPAIKRDQRGAANSMWRGEAASYTAIHLRLGNASLCRCVDCGRGAREWSYQHDCPDEKTDTRTGCRYCHHREHYVPRCRSCHRRYDLKGVVQNV